jgi:sugar phosphate permease
LISDRPSTAKWISKEEKEYIETKLREEQEVLTTNNTEKVSYKQIFSNLTMWKLILIYFFYQVGIYGFALWLPTILKVLTNSGMTGIGIFSMFPYIAMIGGLYLFAQLSDRSMNRRRYTAFPMLGFAVCFLASTIFKNDIWISYAFLIGCGFFMQSASSIFWTIPSLLFPSEVAGGARGIINALGNLGGFIGPFAVGWLITATNNFDLGIYFLVISLVAGYLLTLSLPAKTTGKVASKHNDTEINNYENA